MSNDILSIMCIGLGVEGLKLFFYLEAHTLFNCDWQYMDKNNTEIQSKAKHIAKLVERKIFKLSVINLIKPKFFLID